MTTDDKKGPIGTRLEQALKLRGRSQNWLEREADLARGHANRLVNGRAEGADPETLRKVAERLDISLDWLISGTPPMARVQTDTTYDPSSEKPIRFGDLPGWQEAEIEARERFDDLPSYAFDRAANTSGGRPPTRIDAHSVASLARFWLESTTKEERRQAELEEVARGVKEADKAAGRATPPPPSARTIKRGKLLQSPAVFLRRRARHWYGGETVSFTVEVPLDLPLDRYLRLLLRGEFAQAGEDLPLFEREDYRRIARRFRADCDRPTYFPDPRHFAFVQHVVTICEPVSGECYGEINEGCEILYSCKGGPRMWGLRIYHGLAHWILRNWYANEYTESDAWLLTIEMACLGDYLLEVGPDRVIDENAFVPTWLVRMYFSELRMAA